MTTYTNIDERYGDAVTVTVEDYRELNPDGNFTQDFNGIYEDGVKIAEAVQTFTVSQDDNEIEIDGETFRVVVSNHIHGNITLEIDGGYGLADYEDGSQGYVEIDGNYQVAVLYDNIEPASDGKEFEVTITPEMIADAKRYRANYPLDVESEF